jgi:hypothetical protein
MVVSLGFIPADFYLGSGVPWLLLTTIADRLIT